MQHLTVGIDFFWIMLFVAFAVGALSVWLTNRADRRWERAQLAAAADLLSEASLYLRACGRPFPMALHRRLCDFRARVGA